MNSFWFTFILIACISPLIIVCAVVGAQDTSRGKFDERQLAAQGTCYKAAFFTMIGYYVVYFIGELGFPAFMGRLGGVGIFTGIIVSVGVLAVLCIIKEAYLPPKANKKSNIWLEGFMLFLFLLNFLIRLDEGFVSEGKLTMLVVYLEVAILYAGVLIAEVIKYTNDKKQDDA